MRSKDRNAMGEQSQQRQVTKRQAPQRGREQGSQSTKSGTYPRQLDYSTHISDIRGATVIKSNQVFMLTNGAGDILPKERGYGMYFRDTCFLDQLEFRVQDHPAMALLADASAGHQAIYELTNPSFTLSDGRNLAKERLSMRRVISLKDGLSQTITIKNFDQASVEFDVALGYASHFTNIFTIRGMKPGKRGELHPPAVHHATVVLRYDGADDRRRTTTLKFSPAPDELSEQCAAYHLKLKPGESETLTMSIELEDDDEHGRDDEAAGKQTHLSSAGEHASFAEELARTPSIDTSNSLFDRALSRSLADLRMLATADRKDLFLAAGVPWYVALFGRDSLITAYETLAFHPHLARSTLRLLAEYQGTKHSSFQDEEPGKILHELRVGERANLREAPMIPYYGTVDATPWFLLLLGEYVRWTGDFDLFQELGEHAIRAIGWMDANEADPNDIPGYLSYGSRSEKGLRNQGWKDSDNGIVNTDGTICQPPIALVEAQGYAYQARVAMAGLFTLAGDRDRAARLRAQAADLKQRFQRDFWLDDDRGYALCLQRDRQPSRAVASNQGQTLFTNITAPEHIEAVASRLMQDDMFCGWGVRTLAASEAAYNPLDYQTGSVWPHDNALIALGLRRQGHTPEMEAIFTGIFQAATQMRDFRLPEVFDGFSMQAYPQPVHYPVACSPQAWASGALPLLLQAALGLEPDAINKTLHIHQPHLPAWLSYVKVIGLRVGGASVDLRYRLEDDMTLVAVLSRDGELEIMMDT